MDLKTLSQTLGLSQTTVSRALNGYPEVSEATRAKVREAAKRFNYSPNIRAKGLATGRASAIGHVVSVNENNEMVNPIFGDFIAGAGEVYSANGYEMILSVARDEEAVYRSFKARGTVDGVILHSPKMDDSRIPLLNEIGLPFAVHGRASGVAESYNWIDVNNRNAFRRATEFLLDLGHRRIALLNGLETMDFAYRRRGGYEDALAAHGIPCDPDLMCSDSMTENYGHSATLTLLDQPAPPTAILVSSIITAFGVRRALQDRGLTMGSDVSVVTFDDSLSYLGSGGDIPTFTAARSSVRKAGQALAQMLLDHIAQGANDTQSGLLEAELTIGRSTGPPRT